ncbi:hypothetical protein ACFYY8_24800 [Streptosporangium sp. NPDC001559]|uniref:hypothetical protein n=1 Tax=Streptosporangium sp. NPDC001559 TaxID=3366187 RepID=UPI0036EEC7CF
MRTRPALLAVTAAALAVTLQGLPAHAATGPFIYHVQPDEHEVTLNSPVDEQCYDLGQARGLTQNDTNRDALIYTEPHCEGPVYSTLHSGSRHAYSHIIESVRFVR